MIRNFEDLLVWQEAHHLTLSIYQVTALFPKEEQFGITSQMRRAAVSVENNIAEGFGRRTTKDYASFLYTSLGSLFEIQSMIRLTKDLDFIIEKDYQLLLKNSLRLHKMLKAFIGKLYKNPRTTNYEPRTTNTTAE